jgi:zinc protease
VTVALGNRSRVVITATGAPQSTALIEAAMREEIARLLRDGVSAEEVDVARRQLLEARRLQRSNDRLLAQALLAHLDAGRGFGSQEARADALLREVTAEQVQAALRQLLLPDRWITVVLGALPAGTVAP